MAIEAGTLTVTDTPVALNETSNDGVNLYIRNVSLNALDLGPSDVSGGNGYGVPAGELVGPIYVQADEQLYAVRSGALNATIDYLRLGV